MNDSREMIEMHLIQNFAPSNLNRDDTGQPKSAVFGGVRRARISSQCGKRAVRARWRERGTVALGYRTKRLQQLIGDVLAQDNEFTEKIVDQQDRKDGICAFTDAYYAKSDHTKNPEHTSVLVFIGPEEVRECAQAIRDLWDDTEKPDAKKSTKGSIASVIENRRKYDEKARKKKEGPKEGENSDDDGAESPETTQGGGKGDKRPQLTPVKEIIDKIRATQVSADIALFGRMLAEQPGRNTDGACQVAHPISTHKVDMEMDFYTAVDDLNPVESTGAGMMGIIGFNSACYYRYALVDRDQLARNLARKTERKGGQWVEPLEEGDYAAADQVIEAFLEAMVYAIPTGKQNSFAAQNLPSFGLFVRRKGGVPISLANAFAQPIRPTKDDDDLIGLSVHALTKHWDDIRKVYGHQGVEDAGKDLACFHLGQEDRLNSLSSCDKGSVEAAINAILGKP